MTTDGAQGKNGNGFAGKALGVVMAGLWVALAAFFFGLNTKVDVIKDDMAKVKGIAERTEIEVRRINSEAAADATAQRNRSTARIQELEALQQQRDRETNNPPEPRP